MIELLGDGCIVNVGLTRKLKRKRKIEGKTIRLYVPSPWGSATLHDLILGYCAAVHTGWMIAGYAPHKEDI